MIISIVGAVLAMIIPPVGIVIAIIGIISMIRKIISVIKMIPMLLLGILFAVFLFADVLLAYYGILSTSEIYANPIRYTLLGTRIILPRIMFGYIGLSLLTSLVLAFKYSLKNAMLRQVVIFMAIPITALIIYLAKTFMANAFYQPGEIQQSGIHRGKIWVNDYTRADGTLVHGFWRHLPMKK